MKTCPLCDGTITEQTNRCSTCGHIYWEPDHPSDKALTSTAPEEKKGCLSFLLLPIITAVATVAFLIIAGFFLQMIFHFESSQIKIIWTAGSVLFGILIFHIIQRLKKNRPKGGEQ